MIYRRPMPVAVYQITRMLPFVSATLPFLLLPGIRRGSPDLAEILVDLVVRYVLAAPSEFVKEDADAQARLFPGLPDPRLLVR